ncbi:MAG TPA: VWA domain-containing protein [Blastocatellia bacterium]|nr:VWA domain-containing protein [Blastocatellia bacterium]
MNSFRIARLAVSFFLIACITVLIIQFIPEVSAQSGRKPQRPAPGAQSKDKKPEPDPSELRLPSAAETKSTTRTAPTPSSETQAALPADEGVVKVDTTLVSIPVSVLDQSGRYVPFLKPKEFHIYENGVEQEIVEFRAVNTPFHVALLLDTSGSTRFRLEDIQNAAIRFIEQLQPEDRVMVVSFDSGLHLDCGFTGDREVMRQAIRQTKTGGSTRLYDAVDVTLTEQLNQIEGRKAIVLFTDGVDTSSRDTSQTSIRLVEESNVVVYPVKYDTEERTPYYGGRGGTTGSIQIPGWPGAKTPTIGGGTEDYHYAGVYLQKLAEASGGRLHNADTLSDVDRAFARIAEELRHQYLLSYYPSNTAEDGSYRSLKVRVDQPDLIVRARQGYRAKGGPQTSETKKGKRPTLQPRKPKN